MDARTIQRRLVVHGFAVTIDGEIGPETKEALSKFQKGLGLLGTGVPGPKTFAALAAAPLKSGQSIPKHIEIARKFEGLTETPGKASNPVVEQFFADAGFKGLKDDVPWCAAFVASMLKRAGLPNEVDPKMRLWAASYANCGVRIAKPAYGCIGVKTRNGGGHVGFVVAANDTHIWLLGGNQGDKVSVAKFARYSGGKPVFTAFCLPTGIDLASLPKLPTSAVGVFNPSQA